MISLYKIVDNLKNIINKIPNVGTIIVNDIYELNTMQNVKYPAYAITQQDHIQNISDETITFHFIIFYADRLTSNGSNKLLIQSTAINNLKKIVDTMDESGATIDIATYTTFKEKFNDVCAGAYVDVSFTYDANDCGNDVQIQ